MDVDADTLARARKGARSAGRGGAEPPPPEPLLVRLADVVAEPVRWLMPGWMPEGALVVLDGDPGLGKSQLTLDIAARVSTGRVMPPGDGPDLRGPAGVLLLGAEDSLKHTVRPRLDAAGADSGRVYSFEGMLADGEEDARPPLLPGDLARLAGTIRRLSVKLVVVDPFMSFLTSDTDAHKDQDIRRTLRPMSRLAESLGVTVLLLRHLNKLSGGPALYRGTSSIGITAAARASIIVGRDPDDDRHVMAMNKCNLAPRPASLAYRLVGSGWTSRVEWDGEVDLRPDEILGHGGPPRAPGRPPEQANAATLFLAAFLGGGPRPASEVQAAAEAGGHAWRTVMRAKSSLGVHSVKHGDRWVWSLNEGSLPKIRPLDVGILPQDDSGPPGVVETPFTED